jgi:hypothetical protein
MLQCELNTVTLLVFFAYRLRRHDEHIFEYLLCEVPVLRCRATADIGRLEERGDEYPCIVQNSLRPERIDRRSNVGSSTDAPQPALLGPPRQALGSCGSVQFESVYNIIDVNNVACRRDHSDKLGTPLREG